MKPRGRRSQTSTTSAEERDLLQIRFVDCFIGHGVFAKRKIKNKELVCYYNGELVTGEEGERRLSVANNDGSFLFFFGYRGKHLCIDGTRASGCGRMINDSARHPNCKVKLLEDGGKPKLAIIAIKDIDINNELRFDYGDKSCHWRKAKVEKKMYFPKPDTPDIDVAEPVFPDVADTPDIDVAEPVFPDVTDTPDIDVAEPVFPDVADTPDIDVAEPVFPDVADTPDIDVAVPVFPDVADTPDIVVAEPVFPDVADTPDIDVAEPVFPDVAHTPDIDVAEPVFPDVADTPDIDVAEPVFPDVADTPDIDVAEPVFPDVADTPDIVVAESFEETEVQDTVLFIGMGTNKGFLKLFPQLTLAGDVQQAKTVIVTTDNEFITSRHHQDVFLALAGRCRVIVSSKWVNDSVQLGCLQDKDDYIVRGTDLGMWSVTEKYREYEYQIGNGVFFDITVDKIRHLLNAMGGHELLSRTEDTIYICADNELLSSDKCVHKEWVYKCIAHGAIISPDAYHSSNPDIIDESDAESSIISLQGLESKGEVTVQTTRSRAGHKVPKRLCCVFCESLTVKLYRHLEQKHSTELDVARALSFAKKSQERRKAWAELAARGMFIHNEKIKSKGTGVIIPKYRSRHSETKKEYLPCEFCKAEFVSTAMWKHHKSCPAKPSFVKSDGPVKNSRLISPLSPKCSEEFMKNIIGKMRNDIISLKVKTDPLIIQFGERKYEQRGKHAHTHNYLSEKLRSLGRLMCTISQFDSNVTKLEQCLTAQKWELLLKAVKCVAEYDAISDTFNKPSLAEKLGHYIKKCANIIITNARKDGDNAGKEVGKDFLEIYKEEWTDRIGSKAYQSKSDAKYNKVQRLPLVEDVKKLTSYIKEQIEKTISSQEESNTKHNKLAQLCLAQVLLFNRKRSGEAQRLQSDTYRKAAVSDTPVDEDVKRCLSKFEQGLCKNHVRIETRGKKGRKVAILLTNQMKRNIEALISLKKEHTEFLFQVPGSGFPIRGADVLRKFSKEAGLKNPFAITSTSLRKQLATLSQVLNLDHNDEDVLTNFMGHDLNVHREYYRLPQSTLEIAKVSKVLHALNMGSIEAVKNRDLDDIDPSGNMVANTDTRWYVTTTDSEMEEYFRRLEKNSDIADALTKRVVDIEERTRAMEKTLNHKFHEMTTLLTYIKSQSGKRPSDLNVEK